MSDTRHTRGPWTVKKRLHVYAVLDATGQEITFQDTKPQQDCGNVTSQGRTAEETQANARLIAASPELLEAINIMYLCGEPVEVSLYDEECIEGWRWDHPDGREWIEMGDWSERPPMHPVACEAIAKATEEEER